ncbi:MAG TPA: 3-oxoacid CoA-transferase subunit B [Candidatus Lambdaproteobacteria bacterium]|nr:3-oxoacid CoA-transferase subunit B [Candidatus Lambdaproteobacteria bacterium]HIB44784.1 3-oxoacid CoA-transferase subunit B [Candidatus Lambdaproteobacteria bacterium]
MMSKTERILRRAAKEIEPGFVINLGIGLPTLVPDYLPDDFDGMIHSENGILGCGPTAKRAQARPSLIDSAGHYITLRTGSSCFDSSVSFSMIRRGRIDLCMLGAFEVDELGNLANWKIPGKLSPGIGGAMELSQKAKRLIVLSTHTDKHGRPKILERCRLPLTAPACVNRIITDEAVMDVTPDGLLVQEIAENLSPEELQNHTEAKLIFPETSLRCYQ